MKRSMLVASALMTFILVFTACGGAATATPPPTQDMPAAQDVPLTTIIVMARANEIREIHVDGKKLTVYAKTIARGGADKFVSRIGADTDIIGLLIDSGVDVGPPNGALVIIKGVSAEDVQAAISSALAQAPTPIAVRVTPTPVPALTSTPTPTANPTTIPLPQLPLMRLRNDGQVYMGEQGNFCWPVDAERPGDRLCGTELFLPWEVLDTATAVPVAMGDRVIVEIDADDRPKGLQVAIFDNASKTASSAATQVIKLETGFTTTFDFDLPAGTYYIRISGQWEDGDIAYKFKLVVTS